MVTKRNGTLKSRGVADSSSQRVHADKNKLPLPTLDFYLLKYVCAIATKEGRDIGIVDLSSFFLQTGADKDNKHIVIKVTQMLVLILVECDLVR